MLVLWYCWPRSGSTWASSVFARAVGLPWNPEGGVVQDQDAVHRVHWTAWESSKRLGDTPCKKILSVRDPRDVVVSYYYHVCYARDEVTVDNMSLLDYMKGNFLRLTPPVLEVMAAEPPCSWSQFYRDWRAEQIDAETRHEDMLAHPEAEIRRLAEELGFPIVADIQETLASYPERFRPAYTREYTERQPVPYSVPRGQSRWGERLSGEGLSLLQRECADVMQVYGYL